MGRNNNARCANGKGTGGSPGDLRMRLGRQKGKAGDGDSHSDVHGEAGVWKKFLSRRTHVSEYGMVSAVSRLAVIIPARFASVRLPAKALADIHGAPMVVRVLERVRNASGVDAIAVATDDARVKDAVERAGGRAVMTSAACANGTTRVAEVARSVPADFYVNVQGDEPLLAPGAIERVAALLRAGAPMATLARPASLEELGRASVVKVVLGAGGRALYFSRATIPHSRDPHVVAPLAHVGIYGFASATLHAFAALPETDLERAEGLEQLRAIFHGIPCIVGVGDYGSPAVDTQEDLDRVRALVQPLSDSRT